MNALFDKLDKDKSGQLEYKEMLKAIEGSRKSDKAKIALERKLLEEKRAREAAEARAAPAALSALFAAAKSKEHDKSMTKGARGAMRKTAGETDAREKPLVQLSRRLRVAWKQPSLRPIAAHQHAARRMR